MEESLRRRATAVLEALSKSSDENRFQELIRLTNDQLSLREAVVDLMSDYFGEGLYSFLGKVYDGAAEVERKPPEIEGYEINELVGVGGQGEVWLATDSRLGRTVAIKVPKTEIRGRREFGELFVEAQITCHLEHPGIVPVYSAGTFEFGGARIPFYVMRMLSNTNFKERINQFHAKPWSTLDMQKLLQRFVDVCDTISYVHGAGIIHCDIKPGNIMVGDFGETLVVDWGMAVPIRQAPPAGEAGEAPAFRFGTLRYMPPEQARGDLGQLGIRSDIYSLGATLYCIVTGQTPFPGDDPDEVLQQVIEGRLKRPIDVCRQLPVELNAVCLKAMAADPENRYQTVSELSADISRYLAGEPVAAYKDPLLHSVRRWIGKNPKLVVRGIAATFAIGLAMGLFSLIISGKNVELSEANKQLAITHDIARENEALAREQSQLVISTLNTIAFETQRELERTPGTLAARKQILNIAIERLGNVNRRLADAVFSDRSTAIAMMDLGDLAFRFASEPKIEFNGAISQVGFELRERSSATQTALSFYEKSHQILESLLESNPESKLVRQDLAWLGRRIGDVRLRQGNEEAAIQHYQDLLEFSQEKFEADPSDPVALKEHANAHMHLAAARKQNHQTDKAIERCQRGIELFERSLDLDSGNKEARRELAKACSSLAALKLADKLPEEAEELLTRAREIAEQLALEFPDDKVIQWDVSLVNLSLGRLKFQQQRPDESIALLEKSIVQLGDLRQKRSQSERLVRTAMANGYESLGNVLFELEKPKEAIQQFNKMLVFKEAAAKEDANNLVAIKEWGIALGHLGRNHLALGNLGQARDRLEQCAKVFESALEPDSPTVGAGIERDLSIANDALGDLELRSGDLNAARKHFQRSLQLKEKVLSKDSTSIQAQDDLTVALDRLGGIYLQTGPPDQAEKLLRRSCEIRKSILEQRPGNRIALRKLALSHERLGNLALGTGRSEDAMSSYEECLEIRIRIVGDDVQSRRDLAFAYDHVGDMLLSRSSKKAVKKFELGWEIRQKLAKENRGPGVLRDLTLSLERLGRVSLDKNDVEVALKHFGLCVGHRKEIVKKSPADAGAKRDLIVALFWQGSAHKQAEKWRLAYQSFQKAEELAKEMAEKNQLPGFSNNASKDFANRAAEALTLAGEAEKESYADAQE